MIGVVHIGVDPVALHLGGLAVHWYGILYAVAFAAGSALTARRRGAAPRVGVGGGAAG
jgi:phosphatidylglycerol:prolipoprotein diacylglycerol transferase